MEKIIETKEINSAKDMEKLGAYLAKTCNVPSIIFLQGVLGAGKTTLVRGFLGALGFKKPVKSPTYTLVESYFLQNKQIYHFDFYRLVDADELEHIGIRDYFAKDAIFLIEWPAIGKHILPMPDFIIDIEVENNTRKVKITKT